MDIFIFDENWKDQVRLEEMITEVIKSHNLSLSYLEIFTIPNKLLDVVRPRGLKQLYIIELSYGGRSDFGLNLAKHIRLIDPLAHIIFYTREMGYYQQVFNYHLELIDYISKDLQDKELYQRLSENLLMIQQLSATPLTEELFNLKTIRESVHIIFKDILYVETTGLSRQIAVVTDKHRIELSSVTLSEVLSQEPRFFRCHRSFLVNPHNIYRVDRRERLIYFNNGESIPVSRGQLEPLIKKLSKKQ